MMKKIKSICGQDKYNTNVEKDQEENIDKIDN